MKSAAAQDPGIRISRISILINLILSLIKAAAGLLASSGALISDAVHSLSDVLSTVIVILGLKISRKEDDAEHPYGHERFESVAGIVLAVMLAGTGLQIGKEGLLSLLSGSYKDAAVPGLFAAAAALLSILVKEIMARRTLYWARELRSDALKADAWHHRSDSLSSVGAFLGVLLSRLGFPFGDPAAQVVISLFILKAALDIFREAIDKMVDKSAPEEEESAIRELILSRPGVEGLDLIKTRVFGSRIYVDAEIEADENLRLKESHAIAEDVHDAIEAAFPDVKHIMIHVNPAERPPRGSSHVPDALPGGADVTENGSLPDPEDLSAGSNI